jgi:hypothetical protein
MTYEFSHSYQRNQSQIIKVHHTGPKASWNSHDYSEGVL